MLSFYTFAIDLIKARTHKYIRRVPIGATKTGGTKYMYYYQGQEAHGQGMGHESELVEGSSFAFGEGENRHHAHIKAVDGDKVTIEYDDGAKRGKKKHYLKLSFKVESIKNTLQISNTQKLKEKQSKRKSNQRNQHHNQNKECIQKKVFYNLFKHCFKIKVLMRFKSFLINWVCK